MAVAAVGCPTWPCFFRHSYYAYFVDIFIVIEINAQCGNMLSVLALSALASHGAGVRRHGNVSFVFMMVSCICCNYVAIYPVMDYSILTIVSSFSSRLMTWALEIQASMAVAQRHLFWMQWLVQIARFC